MNSDKLKRSIAVPSRRPLQLIQKKKQTISDDEDDEITPIQKKKQTILPEEEVSPIKKPLVKKKQLITSLEEEVLPIKKKSRLSDEEEIVPIKKTLVKKKKIVPSSDDDEEIVPVKKQLIKKKSVLSDDDEEIVPVKKTLIKKKSVLSDDEEIVPAKKQLIKKKTIPPSKKEIIPIKKSRLSDDEEIVSVKKQLIKSKKTVSSEEENFLEFDDVNINDYVEDDIEDKPCYFQKAKNTTITYLPVIACVCGRRVSQYFEAFVNELEKLTTEIEMENESDLTKNEKDTLTMKVLRYAKFLPTLNEIEKRRGGLTNEQRNEEIEKYLKKDNIELSGCCKSSLIQPLIIHTGSMFDARKTAGLEPLKMRNMIMMGNMVIEKYDEQVEFNPLAYKETINYTNEPIKEEDFPSMPYSDISTRERKKKESVNEEQKKSIEYNIIGKAHIGEYGGRKYTTQVLQKKLFIAR